MSLLCPKCRQTYRIVGACTACGGSRDEKCHRCYGTGREIACGCASAAGVTAPGIHAQDERPVSPVSTKKYGRPEEPTLEALAERARERRGTPRRRVHFDHDFRDGRCVLCGKLEMLAGPHGWSCA